MKNKAGMVVLLAEIIAIIVLHTTRPSKPDNDKSVATPQSESIQYPAPTVSYTSLK